MAANIKNEKKDQVVRFYRGLPGKAMVLTNKGRDGVSMVRDWLREKDVKKRLVGYYQVVWLELAVVSEKRGDVKKVLELVFRAQESTFREVVMFSMAQASSGVLGIEEKSRCFVS